MQRFQKHWTLIEYSICYLINQLVLEEKARNNLAKKWIPHLYDMHTRYKIAGEL